MDRSLLEELCRSDGGPLVLSLIIAAEGSTPRKPGAAMLSRGGVRVAGSVGGGPVEARTLEVAERLARGGDSALLRCDLEGADAAGPEPICGGWAEIAVLRVDDRAPFLAARDRVAEGGSALLVLEADRRGGSARLRAVLDGKGRPAWGACEIDETAFMAALGGAAARDAAGFVYEPVLAPERLLVLGGGHVGKALASVALGLGFEVTVADPRPEFSDPATLPAGAATIRAGFAEAVARLAPGSRDYAVVVSPGHRGDLEAVRALLGRDMRYIGLIGSRRKTRMVLEALVSEGFERGEVERLCSPVGLDIGAETPEEIAVAIAAELIAYRRRGPCLSYLHEERLARRARPYV